MGRLFLIFLILGSCLVTTLGKGFNPRLFKEFVEMRVGTGEPIYWYCIGEISERKIAGKGRRY
jgi:hypothetical protein